MAVARVVCKPIPPIPLCHLLQDTGWSNNAKHVAGNFLIFPLLGTFSDCCWSVVFLSRTAVERGNQTL